ncbi:MAG: tRNA uridine-5-carboxymethylaminomethyl(34) synthesis GTPase MnmE [Bacteroidetes bacterium]|nr:tRNA uridine-5-carboxymethylaminomethyl(34) synthesis GTPase MnmE [Bacteroidota bacterium]MBL7104908.1 tRNA uridine-5-carboxymethylaminomethyl(34) synthesis GTPase MnmE [Bacteroidales bacterium]
MNPITINHDKTETICALATPHGSSAIAIIRISGPKSIEVCEKIFKAKNKKIKLSKVNSHTIHFGNILKDLIVLDEVLVSVFRAPNSYTGEDSIEISCHGSAYIQQKIIELLIKNGLRLAKPGEFTLRAFLNGKFDLSQAEAVADLIASHSKTSHELALNQMRGGFSNKIKQLRQQLVNFASLIELELDFSEEDVEFADRKELKNLLTNLKIEISALLDSFKLGNVLKKGIPVAIVGQPNVGKSTLLNAILNEERAIVSEIPGTTRDAIEDTIIIKGVSFRFIDTAGLNDSTDKIEKIGIERTYEKIDQAKIILYVFDVSKTNYEEIKITLQEFKDHIDQLPEGLSQDKKFILIANKTDLLVEAPKGFRSMVEMECIFVSAKRKENINLIVESLSKYVESENITDATIVSNTRHYEALSKSLEAIESIEKGFSEGLPSDLIAIDIKTALHHLGEITGEITTNEILDNIFSKFCVGK